LEKIENELGNMCDARDQIEAAFRSEPSDALECGMFINDEIKPMMESCRRAADKLENLIDKAEWPFPDYTDLLFYV